MFKPLGLFSSVTCPDLDNCTRNPCPFSHLPPAPLPRPIPIRAANAVANPAPATVPKLKPILKQPQTQTPERKQVPAKRSVADITPQPEEPPRKVQAVASVKANGGAGAAVPVRRAVAPVAVPAASTSGAPVLRINAAHSRIPMKDRQTMLGLLYDTFVKLYESVRPHDPMMAHDHALAQEADVYDKTNKTTYRNGVITSVATIKKRPPPTHPSHASIGTESTLAARARDEASLSRMSLTSSDLRPIVLSREELIKWEYVVDVPEGPGGDRVHEEGGTKVCERCQAEFVVRAEVGEQEREACRYHWARPRTQKNAGKKEKFYACCSSFSPTEGCQLGAHVFREVTAGELHARHAFRPTLPPLNGDEADVLDVAGLDCEMVYSTQGMSCARVTVVDGRGEKVLDELVRMDEGVGVLDYNTRFSGITTLAPAVLDLEAVKQALSAFIGPSTILVGHALENDLKTMRMVHHNVVDTVAIYPHPSGPPIRRSLRDLVRLNLGQLIQNAGAEGHSSLEDAVAAVNLVKLWVRDRKKAGGGVKVDGKADGKVDGKVDGMDEKADGKVGGKGEVGG